MPPLEARGNRSLQMNFEHQIKALIFYHLEEHTSGRHLLQVLGEDDFAREVIAPPEGIKKSSFFEAVNSRGLEQLTYVFQQLQAKAAKILPKEHAELGNLVTIDGSLIDAVLSMHWADYRNGCKEAKVRLGFDINQSIPSKIFFTDGKADELPFVRQTLLPGQTGVMDRYYQCRKDFDLSAEEIATIYKLRWNIEIFFGWWKHHLKVYHLIARSEQGLMAQILGGLITYLLLAIYCHKHHQEKVSIKRIRELRIKIQNEARNLEVDLPTPASQQTGLHNLKEQQWRSFAIS